MEKPEKHIGLGERTQKIYLCIARQGRSKQWYESGVAYFLNYKDDKEDGMQKRGVKTKPYINHEASLIDIVYKKIKYCYIVEDQKIKLLAK
jgi:hypothetical protein